MVVALWLVVAWPGPLRAAGTPVWGTWAHSEWALGLGVATVLYLLRQGWLQKHWMHPGLVFQTVLLVLLSWLTPSGVNLVELHFLGVESVSAWMVAFLAAQCLYLGGALLSARHTRALSDASGTVHPRHVWAVTVAALGSLLLHALGLYAVALCAGFIALAISQTFVRPAEVAPSTELMVATAAWLAALGGMLFLQTGLWPDFSNEATVRAVVTLSMLVGWGWRVMALRARDENRAHEAHGGEEALQEHFDMQVLLERRNVESVTAREQAEKMASRQTEFLATMSHELRTPLACVVGLSRMLAANEEYGSLLRKDMGTVERLAVQLLRTVDDGLAFVRQEHVPNESRPPFVQMAHLLRDIKSLTNWLAQQQRNQVHFLQVRNMPARLCFDEQRVRQILVNLVSNAARYCQDGVITLGVIVREKGSIHVMEWLVEDTGRGMDEQEQERFFDPFSKSRDSQGLGIGLALVKRLVQEIQGEIDLQSAKGQGTRFRITIPIQLHVMNEHPCDLEEETEYPMTSAPASVPMALLPHDDLKLLNLDRLRQWVRLGQLSEIEVWLKAAKRLPGLGAETQRLLVKMEMAVKLVDFQRLQELIDQVDTPLSFV